LSTKERTVNVSLRVSETAYRALQEDAKRQNISLNTIANQIFLAYAEYDRFLSKFGMLKVGLPTFSYVLNAASDEAVAEAGKLAGSGIIPSLVLTTHGELSVPGVLEWVRRIGTYSNMIDYSEISHGGRTSITVSHELGPKGSLFWANYLESLLKTTGNQVKFRQLHDSVTFEV
jgi:hypothetical protein